VYLEVLKNLDENDAYYIQFDEPCLSLNLSVAEQQAFTETYRHISARFPQLKIILASYFECYGDNLPMVLNLPVHTLHLDLCRCPAQLEDILATDFVRSAKHLSLGVVDGRNVWKNDFEASLRI